MKILSGEFTPKLLTVLKSGYSRRQFQQDLSAGVIVGIVALPLAIAFAIASGVSPEKGLITAVVAGFLISFLGGSRVQIGGPTGAFVVLVYSIVQEHGILGLTLATIMAGFLMIGFGLARFGNYLKVIPYPLIVGFTSGISLIIFSSQIRDLFGLQMGEVPSEFTDKWIAYFHSFSGMNGTAIALALGTMVITLFFHKITKKVPGAFVAIILSTALVYFFNLPVDTIETRFGDIPNRISIPHFEPISFESIKDLMQPAIAIALLGSIESLLSAVIADGMMGGKHRSNMELIAQGTANIFSGLFGGIPATGAIARTATNVKNGGRTPVAGIVHAIVLLLIMIVFSNAAKLIPLPTLAGILVVVAWQMSEWRQFKSLLKSNRLDKIVLLSTFFLTVFFDLIIAIEVGMILSSFIFMKRMSESITFRNSAEFDRKREHNEELLFEEEVEELPEGVIMYEINGPLFFGASQKFQEVLGDLHQKPKVIILRMRNVPFIDATGISRLREMCLKYKAKGTNIIISGANEEVKTEIFHSEIPAIIAKRNIVDHIDEAVSISKELIG